MNADAIVEELKAERDRLDAAIKALEGATKHTVRKPGRNRGGGITAAGRKKLSEMMKARWAARRKAAAGKKK